jgi:hypothetical protein
MRIRGCYASPTRGESNARREWCAYGGRQRKTPTLVGPTLEIAGDLSCLQNRRLGNCLAYREPSTIRDGLYSARLRELSTYHRDLQNLRPQHAFQCRSNWRHRRIRATSNYRCRSVGPIWQSCAGQPSRYAAHSKFSFKEIESGCQDRPPATFHLAQRSAQLMWSAR